MNITLLNGSPRLGGSTTKKLFDMLKSDIESLKQCDITFYQCTWKDPTIPADTDTLIIGSPLYYDSLPGFFISFLEKFIQLSKGTFQKQVRVYGLINCGFFEGIQNKTALMQMERFAEEAGFLWCGGFGIGGGGMIPAFNMIPDFLPIKKPITKGLKKLASCITSSSKLEQDFFAQPGCSWELYKFGGELSWKQQAKQNGLKKEEELDNAPLSNFI